MAVDFGTDVAVPPGGGIGKKWTLASGVQNLGNALAWRLSTPRGRLAVACPGYAPDYGLDVRAMLNAPRTPSVQANWISLIARECEKDQRVIACDVDVQYAADRQSLTLVLNITPVGSNATLTYVLSVNALTVTLLDEAA